MDKKGLKLKKAKCPYCGKPLEIAIQVFANWSIRADCKACGNEIDFGYKTPDKTAKRVKCLACGEEFWNTQFITGSQGAHCPFCGKHKWEFVEQSNCLAKKADIPRRMNKKEVPHARLEILSPI